MRVLMTCGLLALANATLTITVTSSKIFEPVRGMFKPYINGGGLWIYQLLTCPYCFSHWGALFLYLLAVPLGDYRWFLPMWLMIVALTAPIMAMMGFSLSYLAGLKEDADGHENGDD